MLWVARKINQQVVHETPINFSENHIKNADQATT